MASISQVIDAVHAVKTAGQAKVLVGGLLTDISRAHEAQRDTLTTTFAARRQELMALRAPLQSLWGEIAGLPDSLDYSSSWQIRKRAALDAVIYLWQLGVVTSGEAIVETIRLSQKTFAEDVVDQVGAGARSIGSGVSGVADFAGDIAGKIAGGLLTGLGPVLIAVIGFVVWSAWKRGRFA